jgi:hypothetical protein
MGRGSKFVEEKYEQERRNREFERRQNSEYYNCH